MKNFKRNRLARAVSLAVAGSVVAASYPAQVAAQDSAGILDEVVVTAQKRSQNLQDVPVSIQVLGNEQMENLGIRGFEDMIDFLPTVSYSSAGPGYAKVYMRGIASGGDGNHSASMPSVGYYLDEQPVTTINQVLDIHMYDIARVETLSGPQGTLYGQGSQSGTIRIITNKPVMGESQFGYTVEANSVDNGGSGYNLNGFANIPLGERAAVRLVAWHEDVAGYINQVPHSLFFPGPTTSTIDNSDHVGDNYNELTTQGLRALLKVDLNENWSVTPGIYYQKSDVEGTWSHNPDFFGDLETATFWDEFAEDEWYQATLTLNGTIGDIDVVYAGAYLNRDVISEYDYSDYQQYWSYYGSNPELGYDVANGTAWCVYYNAAGDCADGNQYVGGDEEFTRTSHELRFQSSQDQSLRWMVGMFYQNQQHDFDLQWITPDIATVDSVVEANTTTYGGATIWQTYQVRDDEDSAFFGELTYDFSDKLTGTFGARYFEYENSLYGFNGFLRHCTGQYIDGDFVEIPEDDGGEIQYPCFDTRILDDVAKGDDWAFKVNVQYQLNEDMMLFATVSEGFRAGGVNRARIPDVPKYFPDFVTNYEFGWKTEFADGRVRFNGAIYQIDWDNFQFNFLDFAVSNLTIVQNVGDSQTRGIESDVTWAVNDGNTLTVAGSYNDATLQTGFWRTEAEKAAGGPAAAPAGTPMPYVPELQLTGIWRSNFDIGTMPSFFQAAVAYTGSRWNDLEIINVPARQKMDAYTLVNLSAGIEKDNWTMSLYVNNATDERAVLDIADPGYGLNTSNYSPRPGVAWTTNTNRPRSYGVRFTQRFGD